MLQIGWYSEDEGLKLNLNLEPTITGFEEEIDNFAEPVSSPLINSVDRSIHGRAIQDTSASVSIATTVPEVLTQLNTPVFSYEAFISRTWTLVVLAVAILGCCAAMWMFIYVLIKMCDGTLTGNQTMGILLLVGVTGLFASVIPWLLPPNEMICTVRHFLHPLIMVLCFAILLVKSMQLRSLVSVGLGGTIPQINQIVSLIFMLLVQVVIAGEWYAASQPLGIVINEGYPECNVSRKRFLLLHLYPCTLLLLAFFYGMTVLKIKRNFNEGRWITCATVFIVPVFIAWSLVYYFAPVQFHDPSVAVSIVAVAGILLAAIFVPKMHTIVHQSKMKNLDLYRSHSDSTVFTGFSDFIAPFPPSKKHQKYYPIYGYNYPMMGPPPPPYGRLVPPSVIGGHHPPPPPPFISTLSGLSPPDVGLGGHLNFNGLNFVSSHQRRGPRLTNYSEWAQGGGRGRSRRRHSSSPMRPEPEVVATKHSPRSKSSTKEASASTTEAARGRSRKRTANANSAMTNSSSKPQTNPKHYLRINTQQQPPRLSEAEAAQIRKEHSRSPSDGMILTASGLRDTVSSEKFENSNVVIVDGGLRLEDEDVASGVYLTTS